MVLVSDHGESFGERGARLHRGSLHREQIQVPLIVRAPGLVPAGGVVTTPLSLQSLPATLADALGIAEASFPGPSLLPLLSSGDEAAGSAEPLVIGELARHPWPEYRRRPCYDGALRSLVRGRWHCVWHEAHGAALFDWVADPREEHDLAAEQPAIVQALERVLQEALAGCKAHPNSIDASDLSANPELAGIGYAGPGDAIRIPKHRCPCYQAANDAG